MNQGQATYDADHDQTIFNNRQTRFNRQQRQQHARGSQTYGGGGIVTKSDLGKVAERIIKYEDAINHIGWIFGLSPQERDVIQIEVGREKTWSMNIQSIPKKYLDISLLQDAANNFGVSKSITYYGNPGDSAYECEYAFKFYWSGGKGASPPNSPTYYINPRLKTKYNYIPTSYKANALCLVEVTTSPLPISNADINNNRAPFKNLFEKMVQFERILGIENYRGQTSVDLILIAHDVYSVVDTNYKELLLYVILRKFFFCYIL